VSGQIHSVILEGVFFVFFHTFNMTNAIFFLCAKEIRPWLHGFKGALFYCFSLCSRGRYD